MSLLAKLRVRPGSRAGCIFFGAACLSQTLLWAFGHDAPPFWMAAGLAVTVIFSLLGYVFIGRHSPREQRYFRILRAYAFMLVHTFSEALAVVLFGSAVTLVLGIALTVTFVDLQPLTERPPHRPQ